MSDQNEIISPTYSMKLNKVFIIIVGILVISGCTNMKMVYTEDKATLLERNGSFTIEVITEELIKDLPEPLRKYLRVCGYIGTPIPVNANVYWAESWLKMSPKKDWRSLNTIQFNSINPIGRVAYMKFLSMPVVAQDLYRDGYGEMNGKLLNLVRVVFDNSKETAQSALITSFSEFMLIPGYLFLENVRWEYIDDLSVRGILIDNGIQVSGIFHFNEEGLFTYFETDDRYFKMGKNTYEKVRFSAIVEGYKMQGDVKICEKVKIVWHLPEGDYEYYKGVIEKIVFNVTE